MAWTPSRPSSHSHPSRVDRPPGRVTTQRTRHPLWSRPRASPLGAAPWPTPRPSRPSCVQGLPAGNELWPSSRRVVRRGRAGSIPIGLEHRASPSGGKRGGERIRLLSSHDDQDNSLPLQRPDASSSTTSTLKHLGESTSTPPSSSPAPAGSPPTPAHDDLRMTRTTM
jgi:hypothetical protein